MYEIHKVERMMEQRMLRPAAPSTSFPRPLAGRPHPAEPGRGAAAGPTLRPARGVVEAAQPLRLASSVAEAASRVCASPAPELAAFSPAKKSVSLAAACRRRGPRHGGNPCSPCPCPSTLSSNSALSFRCRSRSVRVRETCFCVGSL